MFLALAAAPLIACQPSAAPATAQEQSPAGLDLVPLSIDTGEGVHRFIVEVARTGEEQAQGMMYRQSLAPDRGMLFPYQPPQSVSFWMKDTFIPLDIIFIAPGGTIARIEKDAVPLSLEPIPSLGPVEAVLELAGGRASELGLEPGDRVAWQR